MHECEVSQMRKMYSSCIAAALAVLGSASSFAVAKDVPAQASLLPPSKKGQKATGTIPSVKATSSALTTVEISTIPSFPLPRPPAPISAEPHAATTFRALAPSATSQPETLTPQEVPSCDVCKNQSQEVGNIYGIVAIPGSGEFSCLALQYAGLAGALNGSFCPIVQDKVIAYCNCSTIGIIHAPTTTSPGSPSLNTPSQPPSLGFDPYPFTGFPVCYSCQNRSANLVSFEWNPYWAPGNLSLACADPSNRRFGGFLDPSYCSLVQNGVEICNCYSGSVPGGSLGYPACHVCKNNSLVVGNPYHIVTLPGELPSPCLELQNAGLGGFLDPVLCPFVQDEVVQSCNCSLPSPTQAPTVIPTFVPVNRPTFAAAPTFAPVIVPIILFPSIPNSFPTLPPLVGPTFFPVTTPPAPTFNPGVVPTKLPVVPSVVAPTISLSPIVAPTFSPVPLPSFKPVILPTFDLPYTVPTFSPIPAPVAVPEIFPSTSPNLGPSAAPSFRGSFIFNKRPVYKTTMHKRGNGYGGAAGRLVMG